MTEMTRAQIIDRLARIVRDSPWSVLEQRVQEWAASGEATYRAPLLHDTILAAHRAAVLAELTAEVEEMRVMMPDETPWNCGYDPSPLVGVPLGMHHCPQCGLMVMAGMPHPTGSAAVLDLIRKAAER